MEIKTYQDIQVGNLSVGSTNLHRELTKCKLFEGKTLVEGTFLIPNPDCQDHNTSD